MQVSFSSARLRIIQERNIRAIDNDSESTIQAGRALLIERGFW